MAVNAVGLGLQGFVFSACLHERLEDSLWVMEVVVDDVDKEVGLHQFADQFLGW